MTSHGGGNEQVVKPVGMVLEAVKVVERRATSRVIAARASSVGVEVPLQGHGTYGETGGLGRAMQIAHRVEAPVLMVHEPIERVGGAMGAREAIRARELGAFAAEFEDHLPECSFERARIGPLAQTAQPLGELRSGAGVVGRPDPGQDTCTRCSITPTALGDLHNRVEEAQDDAHRREEAPPGALRPFPAISAHRLGAVGGRKRAGLLGKLSVGDLQSVGGGRLSHGSAEDAAASYGGRHIDFLPQCPGVLLVSQQVCGELLGLLDGAAHDGGPSQGHFGPVPVHRVASEHVDQGVKGHAPVAQIEGFFHFLGPPHHVGQ